MNTVLCGIQTSLVNVLINFFYVLNIECNMINCTSLKDCCMILICFYNQSSKLQKYNLLICLFINRFKSGFKAQFVVKIYRFINIVRWDSNVLDYLLNNFSDLFSISPL